MNTVKSVLALKPEPKPTKRKKLVSELKALGKGKVLYAKDAHPEDLIAYYIAANNLKKIAEAREEKLKPLMHEIAKAVGVETAEGGQLATLKNGDTLERQKRTASEPDNDKLKALLKTRGIELEEVYDEVKTIVLNASKLKFLVDKGKLSEEEVAALHPVGFAMIARPGPELKALLLEALTPEKKVDAPPAPPSGKRVRR